MSSATGMPSVPEVSKLLGAFQGRRVVVVGDAVLDEHGVGRATRLTREAPVPVLELVERSWRPGAATNAAAEKATARIASVVIPFRPMFDLRIRSPPSVRNSLPPRRDPCHRRIKLR